MSMEGCIEERRIFIATCSVAEACQGEHEFDGPKISDVVKEMVKEGWLDDLVVEDCEHLGCPACVEWLKENAECFDELDERIIPRKSQQRADSLRDKARELEKQAAHLSDVRGGASLERQARKLRKEALEIEKCLPSAS